MYIYICNNHLKRTRSFRSIGHLGIGACIPTTSQPLHRSTSLGSLAQAKRVFSWSSCWDDDLYGGFPSGWDVPCSPMTMETSTWLCNAMDLFGSLEHGWICFESVWCGKICFMQISNHLDWQQKRHMNEMIKLNEEVTLPCWLPKERCLMTLGWWLESVCMANFMVVEPWSYVLQWV